ncbi:MAG: oxidoreductase [Burkholderiaceae bacterium]|nr:oxidoreductase [Burkholderiaceae bacterium]
MTEADFLEQLSPDGDVVVQVDYSTINFKDGLAITGKSPVVRKPSLVPGIDLAGRVLRSDSAKFAVGDEVLLNGWGVGEAHSGGLAQMARVKSEWLQLRPKALSAKQAMAVGTAGYTAMLCVQALQRGGVQPGDGEILVTGATGGVGSVATLLLASMGYRVVATTGKAAEHDYLKHLGAQEVLDRAAFSEPGKPLQKERWAGVVDAVGSHTLANACASTRYGGVVTACGLAQGMDFPASVAPFILRGVTLCGIDSVMAPMAKREAAWLALAQQLDLAKLDSLTTEVALADAPRVAGEIMAGAVKGRVVVNVTA